MEKKIAKIGIIAVLTLALVLSSFGGLNFGDTFAKEFNVGATNQTTAQAAVAWDGNPATKFSGNGDGSESKPFEISTGAELAYLAQQVNADAAYSNGKFFKLTADIVLNADPVNESTTGANAWTPIGNVVASVVPEGDPTINQFLGTFDGDSHTVSGIYINDTSATTGVYIGLFGTVGSDTVKTATIKNVGVINSYINGYAFVGGVVGNNYGSVINCYNTGAVNGADYVGGVVGNNYGSIINCYNTGKVNGTSGIIGGVVGKNEKGGSVVNCYNTDTVNGVEDVGGVAGRTSATLLNCYNTGAVKGNSNVGGIAGYSDGGGSVANCYNRGTVDDATNKGGVVGYNLQNDTTVANCYFLFTEGLNAVGLNESHSRVTNCSAFKTDKKLITKGEKISNVDGALVPFAAGADLLATLNAGATVYNGDNTSKIQTMAWAAGADGYPAFTAGGVTPTPPPTPEWTYPVAAPSTPFASGEGSVGSPYLISTAQELANLSYLVNTANTTYNGADKHFKLTADIVLNDTTGWENWETTAPANAWTPIGGAKDFKGTFDGANHTVSGIYINVSADYIGLFGSIASTATVKNVGVINSYIKGRNSVGGVVGYNFGAITNCYNLGSVNGTVDNIGGVVGNNNNGSLNNCYNRGVVSGRNYIGGVVGYNPVGAITNCYNEGDVTGTNNIGGVAGQHENATVTNCYNLGKVSGTQIVGGVVGFNRSTVVNCYNRGAVKGTTSTVGGVVGQNNNSAVINCYNTGAVTETTTKIGGVAGWNDGGTVKNSYFLKITDSTNSTNETLNAVCIGSSTACGTFIGTDGTLTAETGEIIGKNNKLLDALNAGSTAYNKTEPAPAILAMAWAANTAPSGYPIHTTSSVTPPDPDPTKPFAKGDGSATAPYEISTAQELTKLSELVNNKDATYSVENVHFKLTADIKLNGDKTITSTSTDATPWNSIGESDANPFLGTFDGAGHTVSGIYINGTAELTGNFKGLFGFVGSRTVRTATIKNVGVINSYIKGTYNVGGVVGANVGVIINCYNTSEVTGVNSVGGVAGGSPGTITNCYNTGKVDSTEANAGGVVGNSNGVVSNCYNRGAVSGPTVVGGVIGYNDGAVANCYFSTNKTTIGGTSVAGDAVGSGEGAGKGTATNCSPFGADKKLTTKGDTPLTAANKALVTFEKDADLLATLNLGKTAYNTTAPAPATPAAEWLKGEGDYPAFTAGGGTTPPTGGGDYDSEPSISPEDIFWTGIVTDLKLKEEPVVEFNCKYPRMSRSVLLALQEVDKTLNINLNGEKISITSKQAKSLTFDKATYSVAELKALLEVKPVVTPTPTPTPTEKPTEPVVPETPTANLTWLWILLAVVAVGAVVAVVIVVKKKKNDDNK